MRFRRVVLAVGMVLALLLPAVVLAQGPTPPGNIYSLFAVLRGDNGVPPGDPDGFGYARVTIDLDTGLLCYQLSVANTEAPVAAHIHEGGAGVAGPVVVPFAAPEAGLSRGCVDVEAGLAASILANPSGYYVNVHTSDFAPGAVRGQLALLGGEPVVAPPASGPTVEVLAEGLNSPRGIAVHDGMVYVAQAGAAGDDCVTQGEGEEAVELCFGTSGAVSMIAEDGTVTDVMTGVVSYTANPPEYVGPQDVVVDDDGVYAIVGLGTDPANRDALGERTTGFGQVIVADEGGSWFPIIDISAYETAANPDGGEIDSNPYSAALTPDGAAVTDAGANALLWVPNEGDISTMAVFPDTMVDAPPFLGLPEGAQIPMQAVPTGVVQGPDGAFYVGQLTGFPFVPGAAKVWRVVPGEAPTVYAEGFTNIIDLAFDADGNLYVLEFTAGGLLNLNPEDPATMAGALLKVAPDGTVTEEPEISSQLVTPGGMAFGPDGDLYISNYGLMPGTGQVLEVSWGE